MQVFHGTILSVNEQNQVFRYLVEDGGRIVYIGDTLPESYTDAKKIELGDQALLPAFVDTHQHFASFSTFHAGLNVMEARSNKEILEMVRSFAERSTAKTLVAFGASPYSVAEKRLVTRQELDSACPGKELLVVKYDGHACIVNTKLLNRLRPKVGHLRGYHPDTGEMNQEAFFRFSDEITNSLSIPELYRNMQTAVDFLASRGIGCVHTVSGVGFTGNLDITMEKIFGKSLKNGFQLRVFPQSLDIRVATSRKLPRIGGCFACALDGCFGSHDAALTQPYADDPADTGVLYYDDQRVTDFCKAANRAGLQIELHAIGDRAFDQATLALKAALDDFPREDHRHGIIHCCLPTAQGLAICRDYHIQMPVQSAFIDWPQEPDDYLESILGKQRLERLNPLKSFRDNGIVVSFGSDAPCTTPDPISWIHRAVNHSNPAQAISVEDALRMCTINGCYAAFDEQERGSLEPGKVADMVVLSANPYTTPHEELKNLRVQQLYLAGRPYESCKEQILKAVLRGITQDRKV